MIDLRRRIAAEAIGTGFLVAAVVGSGIMAQRLTGDGALALLCNTLPTGAMLVVLVTILGPISGAHLNPAVTAALAIRGDVGPRDAAAYVLAQIAGGIVGTLTTHLMFSQEALQLSTTVRMGPGIWLAEAIAAFGLVSAVLAGGRFARDALPWLIGLYVTAAYWFTASTSFANPAVTIARALTRSFSGIRPADAPAFIVAQFVGALVALVAVGWLVGLDGGTRDAAPR